MATRKPAAKAAATKPQPKPTARKPAPKPASTRAKPKPKPAAKPAARKAATPKVAAKKPAARKPRKRTADLGAPEGFDLGQHARVVSIWGAIGKFNGRVLLEMTVDDAAQLFAEPLERSVRTNVIEAAERDVALIRKRDAKLGKSALAATAIALAYEIEHAPEGHVPLEHPYNSATSKSMCSREIRETIDRLRELAPEDEEADQLDSLAAQRAARIGAGT